MERRRHERLSSGAGQGGCMNGTDVNPVKTIGILTGGGDCPGLNAVIRSVVKTANLEFAAEVLGIEYGFKGLVEDGLTMPLDAEAIRGILPRGGTILGTTNRADPFHYLVNGVEKDL